MKCLILLLLLFLRIIKCIEKDGQFYIAWIEEGERKMHSIENDYAIPLVRPQSHTLLFKPTIPGPYESWGFYQFNDLVSNFEPIEGGYYSITGGVYSQDECLENATKCWFPEVFTGYKFRYVTKGRTYYETIILRLNKEKLIPCAQFFADSLIPITLEPTNTIIPIAVQENDLFGLNEISFSFGFSAIDNYLDCDTTTIHFYLENSEGKIVLDLEQELRFEDAQEGGSLNVRFPSPGEYTYQAALGFEDEAEMIYAPKKQITAVEETPPNSFLLLSMKTEIDLDKTDRIEVCSTVPDFGSNKTGLLTDSVHYFVVLNETFFGMNGLSDTSKLVSWDTLIVNKKICMDVVFDEDKIGEINLHAVFRNSFGLFGVSEAQKVTVYNTAVPVSIRFPSIEELVIKLKNVEFGFEPIHPKNFGFYDTDTIPERFAQLKMDAAVDLKKEDGNYFAPRTVIANLDFEDRNFEYKEKLKPNTEYHWMITSGFDELHSVNTEVMSFHTTAVDCDSSGCQHDSCSIVTIQGKEQPVCECQNGYHGEFCEKSVFASPIFDYLASYIPFLAAIFFGLILVTSLTIVTFCVVKRFRKQKYNELKETDVNLHVALEQTEQKIFDEIEDNEDQDELIYEL